ncbi:MAG: AmpG family muropeptide MFS transporter [Candidatus Adiutrix sp.]|jgi:PAT family beta-lactamase induction signal transducer AmpG|nr:AmpG family muropeptide MFS transporter [Candidatus Adiutrix sp.]
MSAREIKGAPAWRRYSQRNLISSFCMGFCSGAPLLIVSSLVQGWLTGAGVDLRTISDLALTGLPYSLKFLWSFWLDSCDPPLLGALGRRRSWMLLSQLALMAGLFMMSLIDPGQIRPVAALSFFIAFSSATQDIVIDAYRRDDLSDEELGLGSAYYVWGYRLGMLVISGGGLIAADHLGWPLTFRLAALVMLAGPLTLFFSPEPRVERRAPVSPRQTVIEPLRDFFSRPAPWLILLFIFFYKFGDQLATSLTTNFYLTLGYSLTEIGAVGKFFGTGAILAGVALGGWGVLKMGLRVSLWLFGLYQMVTILGFVALCYLPVSPVWLALVISQENLAAGAGTSAFVAFMGRQTRRRFSVSQYALLSALMALPRTLFSSRAGHLVDLLGWPGFFYLCTALALPAFYILRLLTRRGVFESERDHGLRPL